MLTDEKGYDGSLMGSINAESSYTKYYNLPPSGNSATGIVFAIFNVRIKMPSTRQQLTVMHRLAK